jgi:2-polyprenyl-3-methyl-5-hydroxy-6-metoxy-1,4-benzoquinol methylase
MLIMKFVIRSSRRTLIFTAASYSIYGDFGGPRKKMLRQFLAKRKKILQGFSRTYLRRKTTPYEPETWWDSYYTDGLSDRKTIGRNQSQLSALYHYASVELILLRHFFNHGCDPSGWAVFDVGSGAGHWIDFYRRIGAAHCTGIDISSRAVEFLTQKYADESAVKIYSGLAHEFLATKPEAYDVINAIGVMFHIVDDHAWHTALSAIAKALKAGGLLVAGGHFGLLNKVNVQFPRGRANKRLRSRAAWRRALRTRGFRGVQFYYNPAYLFIKDSIPENNVLIARK